MFNFEIDSTLRLIIESVIAITAVIAIVLPFWRAKNRYRLRWTLIETKSLLDIAEEIAPEILITFHNKTIKDITKYRFVLHNAGLSPIDKNDLKWEGPGKILSVRVAASEPPVQLRLSKNDENILEISWTLFNQSCMALVEVLCQAGINDPPGRISGHIRNIPAIEERKGHAYNEEIMISRFQDTHLLIFPKFLQPLIRLFVNRIYIRLLRWFVTIYLSAFPLFLSSYRGK